MREIWRKIIGHEDYYISTWGRVYSTKSKKLLKLYDHRSRCNIYKRVELDRHKFMVHILVASTYYLSKKACLESIYYPEKIQVDHLDTNTLNNNINNLQWVTESENKKRMYRNKEIQL